MQGKATINLGGNYILLAFLAVPAGRVLGESAGKLAAAITALVVFAAAYAVGQYAGARSAIWQRGALLAVMGAISAAGLVLVGSEWIVCAAMTAVACAALLPLVIPASFGVAITAAVTMALSNAAGGLIVVGAGAIAILRARLLTEIARTRAQRRELAAAAVENERLRIARDLHDVLGNSLVTMVVKAELAERLVPSNPVAAAQAAADVQRVGREAMSEVQAVVSGYRAGTFTDALARVTDPLASVAELTVRVDERNWSDAVDTVLAWTVRECATNIVRHADPTSCLIEVTSRDNRVRLRVVNDGVVTGAARRRTDRDAQGAQGGNGLRGITERVAELGGTVRHGVEGHDHVVQVDLAADADYRGGDDDDQ